MKKHFTILSLLIISSFLLSAQKQLTLIQFATGFSSALDIENCGDSRLFVVQRNGLIYVCDSAGNKQSTPFLDLKNKTKSGGEKGLLGLAFDPKYQSKGFFYVYYINKNDHAQVSRFSVSSDPNLADTGSEKLILEISDHHSASHNGGTIRFGPDKYLYIGLGDGGGNNDTAAQNPMSLLGKMLRIDVHNGDPYSIPATNPFVNNVNYRPEIWAVGFRNPWRWSFDVVTGDMYIADVGEASWEEINIQDSGSAGGENYGWRCYEGKHQYDTSGCKNRSQFTFPVYEYPHVDTAGGVCAIIGGFVYRGNKNPNMYGKYIFTDYCSGEIQELYYVNGKKKVKNVFNGNDYGLTTFGEGSDHELYVSDFITGNIYRLAVADLPQTDYPVAKNAETDFLSVSPNPSNGNFVVSYKSVKSQQVDIRVLNIMGQQFYTTTKSLSAGMNTWTMNLRIPKGDYYISITNASGKMVNQRLKVE